MGRRARFYVIGVNLRPGHPPTTRFMESLPVELDDNAIGGVHGLTIAPSQVMDHDYVIVCTERLAKTKGWDRK